MARPQSAPSPGTGANKAPHTRNRSDTAKRHGHRGGGALWGLLILAGLGLAVLAGLQLIAPIRPSPDDAASIVGTDEAPGDSTAKVPGVIEPTRTNGVEETVRPPAQISGEAPTSPSGSAPATAKRARNPSVAFENAPGVLSISLHTRRKETLKDYPTESLGAIALGLEDLRLTPTSKDDQLRVNLGQGIRYEQDTHEVPKQSRRLLDGIARLLAENPDTEVHILSHTDDEGDAGFNLRLSQRRADALRDYLAGRGVSQDRIIAEGRGETERLVAIGKRRPSRAERAKNRRTELVIESLQTPEEEQTGGTAAGAEGEIPQANTGTTLTAVNGVEAE